MSTAMLDTLRTFVDLKAQYEALVLEHSVVTEDGRPAATPARRTARDLAFIRWEAAYRSALQRLECVCTGATPRGSQDWLTKR
jgi:hypothetical protein